MQKSRSTALTAGGAVVAGGAIAAVVFSLMPASAATYDDNAFGAGASGAVPVTPAPSVASTDGSPKSASLATLQSPDQGALFTLNGLKVSAAANKASASVASGTILGGSVQLPGAFVANCSNAKGSVTVAGRSVTPGTVVKLGAAASLTENVQQRKPDGALIVVAGVLTINTPGGPAEIVNLASATCDRAVVPSSSPPTSSPAPSPSTSPSPSPSSPSPTSSGTPTAPPPTPTTTHLPVTG